jgi:hypothetical protein
VVTVAGQAAIAHTFLHRLGRGATADQNWKTNCEDERRQKYCQGLCALRRAFVNLGIDVSCYAD